MNPMKTARKAMMLGAFVMSASYLAPAAYIRSDWFGGQFGSYNCCGDPNCREVDRGKGCNSGPSACTAGTSHHTCCVSACAN